MTSLPILRIGFLFLFLPSSLYPELLDISIKPKEKDVLISARLIMENPELVLDAIREGLRSKILFQFRLYKKNRGILSFLGNKLIAETEVQYIGYYDLFKQRYMIKRDVEDYSVYIAEGDFLTNFLEIEDCVLSHDEYFNTEDFYVLGKIRLDSVLLVPPLNIITLFSSDGVITSQWQEARLDN